MARAILLAVGLVLAVAPAAAAGTDPLVQIAERLRDDPVFVDPGAEAPIDDDDADAIRSAIEDAGGGIYVAVMPGGNDPDALLRTFAREVGRPAAYVVVAGTRLRAGSTRPS